MSKVSVIVPVYNGERYISSCMECLSKQSLRELEIIFIDDGSTDNTLDKLRLYRDANIIILSQKNAGAGAARNYGIAHANGEYIAFLDVDDHYANDDTLALLYENATENDAVVCGGSLVSEKETISKYDKRIFSTNGFMDFKDYQFDFGFQRFIYKREFLKEYDLSFPEYRIYEDPVFFLKVMTQAKKFYAIKDGVYVYSGAHQKDLDTLKTIDYLFGLKDNLSISAECGYGELHKILFERLKSTASYYAEKNLDTLNISLYEALIAANASIDKKLLRIAGVDVPDTYLIPALHTVWRASGNYMRFRKRLSFWTYFKKK